MNVKPFVFLPNAGSVRMELAQYVVGLACDNRYSLEMQFCVDSPYEQNLQRGVDTFLNKTECTHWIHIDSDNPPTRNVLGLMELDKDVICCPTPVWLDDSPHKPMWNAWKHIKDDDYRPITSAKGLQRVDTVGTGCLVIKRKVLETIKEPFMRTWVDGRVVKGNDLAFSIRCENHGFELYAHFDYPCHHYKTLDLLDLMPATECASCRKAS